MKFLKFILILFINLSITGLIMGQKVVMVTLPDDTCQKTIGIKPINNNSFIFSVYPNPSDGNIILNFSDGFLNKDAEIKVYDSFCKIVEYENINMNRNSIPLNLRQLHSGIYFVWIGYNKDYGAKKIIINH